MGNNSTTALEVRCPIASSKYVNTTVIVVPARKLAVTLRTSLVIGGSSTDTLTASLLGLLAISVTSLLARFSLWIGSATNSSFSFALCNVCGALAIQFAPGVRNTRHTEPKKRLVVPTATAAATDSGIRIRIKYRTNGDRRKNSTSAKVIGNKIARAK